MSDNHQYRDKVNPSIRKPTTTRPYANICPTCGEHCLSLKVHMKTVHGITGNTEIYKSRKKKKGDNSDSTKS